MSTGEITLESKYTQTDGVVLLSGIQALVRIALDQRRRDAAAGHNTAGFISGYRGSPLGGFDLELAKVRHLLDAHKVVFQPGINEDLAATAVWGTQQVAIQPKALYDGVFGLWYGKAPGVDRSGDALKHANNSGTAALGGVLAIAGDDHRAKSSSYASQSEFAFVDAEIPLLNPADVQEVLEFGLAGIAMSRFSGLWVGLIALADTMDSTATIAVGRHRPRLVLPDGIAMPAGGLNVQLGHAQLGARLDAEERLRHFRLPAAQAFIRASRLDRVVLGGGGDARIGIAATGKAYADLRQALELLGIDDALAVKLGFRLYKIAMPWPLEPDGALEFATGLERVLVVEHKRPLIEPQFKELLYHLPADRRPAVIGKTDERGMRLLSNLLDLTAEDMARVLFDLIPAPIRTPAMRRFKKEDEARPILLDRLASDVARRPFFCSGCPHNASTRVPDGSRSMPGVGCHIMAQTMDRTTDAYTHMGGEGAPWLGQAPFTGERHIFVNLGDGTYFHSGILAIRAAVAAKVSMSFKLLYNDAVAMTGGQPVDGPLTVPQVTRQVAAEGVERIEVISERPEIYGREAGFAPGVTVRDRKNLARVQNELKDFPGVSLLIFDQTCAAEKRRRRKRGQYPDPARHLFINDAVCEDCGDCSATSNCLSVEPLETEWGRKRAINQSTCNKDLTCGDGFCPSFVTVDGGRVRRRGAHPAALAALQSAPVPTPSQPSLDAPYNIVLTGVGGTGVTTAAALLATAAHMDGKRVVSMDMTGLAQKGGAVLSHIRIAPLHTPINGPRIPAAGANALLAFDLLTASGRESLALVDRERTAAVYDADVAPTSSFVLTQSEEYQTDKLESALHAACREARSLRPKDAARRLLGDAIHANVMMLGAAYQQGLIPLSADAMEQAIRLNGVAPENNLLAFRAGRLLVHDPDALQAARPALVPDDLDKEIERRVEALKTYQDEAYARRYAALIENVRVAEQCVDPASQLLTRAAARGLFKLMAYKDEYEVARLYADPAFRAKLETQFEGPFKVSVWLAPPLLAKRDPLTGLPRKRQFGPWVFALFAMLKRLKGLRGTLFDPFGHTPERRTERGLISRYEEVMEHVVGRLNSANLEIAVSLAALPEEIRGYGHVKARRIETARREEAKLLAELDSAGVPPADNQWHYAAE